MDNYTHVTKCSDVVNFGPYRLLRQRDERHPFQQCWVIEDGDAVMIFRERDTWPYSEDEESDNWKWFAYLPTGLTEISFCGAAFEGDPQVVANHLWGYVEEMAAMYCGEDGWL